MNSYAIWENLYHYPHLETFYLTSPLGTSETSATPTQKKNTLFDVFEEFIT